MSATATSIGVDLERSYRRLLRTLPPSYRRDREREMVDVMLELSPPDRSRPRVADAFDVAAIAARQWFRVLLLPRRGEGRTVAAALAVILPLVLARPIGTLVMQFAWYETMLVSSRRHGYVFQQHHDWPVWALWALAIALLLAGKAGLARFPAAAATLGFSTYALYALAHNNQVWLAMNVGWLVIQIVALVLLADRTTLEHGLTLVPARVRVAALALAVIPAVSETGLIGIGQPLHWLESRHTQLVVVSFAVATALCLASRAGRIVLPFLTVMFVPLLAGRVLFVNLGNYGNTPTFEHLPLREAALGSFALVVVYAGCRLAACLAARVRVREHAPGVTLLR